MLSERERGRNFLTTTLFRLKTFNPKLSHRILRHMYEALNVDEKKLIVQFGWKSRDERFEPN
jgi:hypothetical protein